MSEFEYNKKRFEKLSNKKNFLIDTSAFQIFEDWGIETNSDLFQKIIDSKKFNFFITTDVLCELSQKRSEVYMNKFYVYSINPEMSASHDVKFDQFIVKDSTGEPFAWKLNSVSATDYAQILLCQNHKELRLVTNDEKMIKSSARLIGKRVMCPVEFLKYFLGYHKKDKDYKVLKELSRQCKTKVVRINN